VSYFQIESVQCVLLSDLICSPCSTFRFNLFIESYFQIESVKCILLLDLILLSDLICAMRLIFRFNLFNVSADQFCQAMQDAVVDAMEGVVDTLTRDDPTRQRRVATYGNSNPLTPGDWVQILREPPVATSVST
jgi:hypothetical protein